MIRHSASRVVLTIYKNLNKNKLINITGIRNYADMRCILELFSLNNIKIFKIRIDNSFFKFYTKINKFNIFKTFCHKKQKKVTDFKIDLIAIHLQYFNCIYLKFNCGTFIVYENITMGIGFKTVQNFLTAKKKFNLFLAEYDKEYNIHTPPSE